MTGTSSSGRSTSTAAIGTPLPTLDVTVVVPSITVDALLVRCVSVCRTLYPTVEIIALVDDAGGSEQVDRLARVVETGSLTIGAKRNMGAELAATSHVAFIDSDAFPEPGWLEAALAHLSADRERRLGAVGGPNVSPPEEPLGERCVGNAHLSPLVAGWWTYRKRRSAPARDTEHLPSCNLVVRRADYQAIGGMDESLFTAEDTDFCRRLKRSGQRIRFEPDVVVVHKNRGPRAFLTQRYTFGVAMVPLLARGASPSAGYVAVSMLPVAAVVHLAAGPLVAAHRRWRRPWAALSAAYGAAVAIETIRVSGRPSEMPGTALAIAVGNLAPGLGLLVRAAGGSRDLRGVYRNDT